MAWTLAAGSASGGVPQRQLTQARSRRFTWRIDGPTDLQFTIDATADEAADLTSIATDIWAWRDGTLMFRGRMAAEQEDISPDVDTLVVSCVDYRGLLGLMGRHVGSTGNAFGSTDQSLMAWTLISDTQALTGGNLGITRGTGQTTGVNRERTIDPYAEVAHEIELIGNLDDGFEWEISADLEFNVYYPTRDNGHGVVVDYGGIVASARRQFDPTRFANSVAVTGSEGLTPATAVTGTIGTDPRGRFEVVESFPSIIDQSTLTNRTPQLLAQTSVLADQWTAVMTAGRWEGQSHIWIGDTVTFAVKKGRHNFADPYRVTELQIAVGESGEETVQLELVAA